VLTRDGNQIISCGQGVLLLLSLLLLLLCLQYFADCYGIDGTFRVFDVRGGGEVYVHDTHGSILLLFVVAAVVVY
jgi:hypothetical protein